MQKIKDNVQFLGTMQNAEGKNVLVEGQGGGGSGSSLATDILLTGYTKAVAHGSILATDNVAVAMGKVDYDVGTLYGAVNELYNLYNSDLATYLSIMNGGD